MYKLSRLSVFCGFVRPCAYYMKTQTLWDYAEVFAMEFEEAPHLIANLRSTKLRLVVDTPQFDLTVQFKIIISRKGERQMTLRFVTSPVTYPQFLVLARFQVALILKTKEIAEDLLEIWIM